MSADGRGLQESVAPAGSGKTSGRGRLDELPVGSVGERHVQPLHVGSSETGVGKSTDTAGLGTRATRAVAALVRGARTLGLRVRCCGVDAYVCRVDTPVDAATQLFAPA